MSKKLAVKKHNLQVVWEERLKLRAEGNKLYAEGNELYAEGNKFCAEGDKLCAEGEKLYAKGSHLWFNAVIKVYGNISTKWKDGACILETGEKFKF